MSHDELNVEGLFEVYHGHAKELLSGSHHMTSHLIGHLFSDTLSLLTKTLTFIAIISLCIEIVFLISPNFVKKQFVKLDSIGCLVSKSVTFMIWVCLLVWAGITKW